ncbi:group I intron-associated PD-(D/E)XK endonuclease [Xylanimonas protaetiae]|uniref:PD(D/E)XK endonuclease domain-containing protein n=1 Tax=Xylanimonas protaetiae TaxID=2509457 RepID=A0A4P6F681_9MICO|nr:group I intron-associated PD-(D/E)XK endonuclease [Xylanimonas protaetiae]QAY70925.1 hypothetical protein ET471_13570 [Xylanimonas protaetiae]
MRSYADSLGLDYSHFRGQRRWTSEDLQAAIVRATTWIEVTELLGLGATAGPTLKGHALRLGIDASHLSPVRSAASTVGPFPRLSNLNRAGSTLAAGWFELCGWSVSWPLEPCRYDLVVDSGVKVRRVQVKTTTTRDGGSWKVYLSSAQRERRAYSPDEIDDFFVIDGDLNYYLIPLEAVGGLLAVHLSSYGQFRLPQAP